MKRISNCTMVLVLGLTAMQTMASAQEKRDDEEMPGIEGVWFTHITPVDCTSRLPIPGAPSFRSLLMFSHDGSLTNEAAYLVPGSLRSSGVGRWQHTQGNMYTTTFRFFRNQEGGPGLVSFLTMRLVTTTILLNGNQFTSFDQFQDYDADNKPLPPGGQVPTSGCVVETGSRLP